MSFEVGDRFKIREDTYNFSKGTEVVLVDKDGSMSKARAIGDTKEDWFSNSMLIPLKAEPLITPTLEHNAVLEKATKYPNNNPKAAVGAKKLPIHQVPPALMIGAAEAMADGAEKYGPYNFRESQIAASVYMGAMLRHLFAWWDGEDNAEDSGVHHMKHVAACAGLILDSMACGTFDDDRPPASGAAEMIKRYTK